MKTKKLTNQIQAFSDTYTTLTECFGPDLPAEHLAVYSGLPLDAIKAIILCKQIEQSVDQLDSLLLKYANISALGFAGSRGIHLINVCDDDTMFITYENFEAILSLNTNG